MLARSFSTSLIASSLFLGAANTFAAEAPKPLFQSPELTSEAKPRLVPIDIPVKGLKELHLIVSDEGSDNCDWADWIEPQIIMADGSVKSLAEVPWKSAESAHGKTQVGKSHSGTPILVESKEYQKAIGTHAPANIVFALPEGAERFTAKVAIDDGGMERGGKPSGAKMKFYVYAEKPTELPKADPGPPLVPTDLFAVPEGLEVTLWASSPMLRNPTNIDFDAKGRMVIAEGVNYRSKGGRQKEGDRIVILEDTKGEGKADKVTTFVQEPALASPLGVAVFENKYVVSQPPDLIQYTDVNGDGKFDPAVDKREVLLTGFNGRQHDHSLHSVTAGPDGQWYWNQGNTGAQFTDKSGKTFYMGSPYMLPEIAGKKSDDGNVWIGGFLARMNPDGSNVTILGHNFRNSYEQTVNSFGDIFQSDNDDPPACRVTEVMEGGNAGFASADGLRSWGADKRPGQDTPTAEWRQEDPGTMPAGDVYGGGSPTGVAFYENGALDNKWRGLLLACEAGKNVVYGYLPQQNGAGFKLERFDFVTSNKEKEFAGSDFLGGKPSFDLKTKFRPSDVCVGPDGAIYVADWFDARVGGHGTLDDAFTGSIYRIAPKGFKPVIPKFDLNTTAGQIAALKSPAVNVRNSGFIRLKAQGAKAVPAVTALLKDENPYIVARAIWLLAQMGEEGKKNVAKQLALPDSYRRLVAYRALRRVGYPLDVVKFSNDKSAAVRREVALSIRGSWGPKQSAAMVNIAKQFDGKDRSYLEAIGLGCTGNEKAAFEAMQLALGGTAAEWTDAFAWLAWRLHPADAVHAFKARALMSNLSDEQRKLMITALAFVKTREAAGAMIELTHTNGFPFKEQTMWWAMNRKNNDWKDFDVEGSLKALGLYDPDKVKLTAVEMPPEPKDAPKLPEVAEIVKLKGDVARGQTRVTVCFTCHKVGPAGVDFGPDITAFGKQQPAEVIITGVAKPSADISHGFEGREVKTKDGLTITGMVLSDGDPLIMKCMGGMVQTIPRSKIASVNKMTRSLMYEPQLLGLDAQAIADIVAYLKSL